MDWLSHNNHTENRDQEIAGMRVNINAICTSVNIPVCTSKQDTQAETCEGAHIQKMKACVIQGRSRSKYKAILANNKCITKDRHHATEE